MVVLEAHHSTICLHRRTLWSRCVFVDEDKVQSTHADIAKRSVEAMLVMEVVVVVMEMINKKK